MKCRSSLKKGGNPQIFTELLLFLTYILAKLWFRIDNFEGMQRFHSNLTEG